MSRIDGRKQEDLRDIKITKDYTKHAEGSVLIEFGETKVICTASVEKEVPRFLRDSGQGWVTAEYGMLPRSTNTRIRRDKALTGGRTQEISRLIGRSLRAVIALEKLGERTIKVDCDVIQADGGTRTASITGGFIALAIALEKIKQTKAIKECVAAISVGVYKNDPVLDLNYEEDANADMDMNVVMVSGGNFVEVQGTAEGKPYSREEMQILLDLAEGGIKELINLQKEHLPFLS